MKSSLLIAAVLMFGCVVDESVATETAPESETQTQAATTVPPPPRPSSPTPFRTYIAKNPQLFPLGLKSAYAVIWTDERDHRYFKAIGYDVVGYKTVFYVRGATTTDLGAATKNIAEGIELNSIGNPIFDGAGSRMKIRIPTPGCCKGGDPDHWVVAQGMHAAWK